LAISGFTDDDGTTLLDYWMQKVTSTYAVFWVEVKDDLSASNATICLYYGKAGVTTASNGDATFLGFDDFSGSSLNTTKWLSWYEGSWGTVSVSNGCLDVTGAVGAGWQHVIYKTGFGPNTSVVSNFRYVSDSGTASGFSQQCWLPFKYSV
jgi:hypothetical protein